MSSRGAVRSRWAGLLATCVVLLMPASAHALILTPTAQRIHVEGGSYTVRVSCGFDVAHIGIPELSVNGVVKSPPSPGAFITLDRVSPNDVMSCRSEAQFGEPEVTTSATFADLLAADYAGYKEQIHGLVRAPISYSDKDASCAGDQWRANEEPNHFAALAAAPVTVLSLELRSARNDALIQTWPSGSELVSEYEDPRKIDMALWIPKLGTRETYCVARIKSVFGEEVVRSETAVSNLDLRPVHHGELRGKAYRSWPSTVSCPDQRGVYERSSFTLAVFIKPESYRLVRTSTIPGGDHVPYSVIPTVMNVVSPRLVLPGTKLRVPATLRGSSGAKSASFLYCFDLYSPTSVLTEKQVAAAIPQRFRLPGRYKNKIRFDEGTVVHSALTPFVKQLLNPKLGTKDIFRSGNAVAYRKMCGTETPWSLAQGGLYIPIRDCARTHGVKGLR